MKATLQQGKGKAGHNDRNFNIDNADNIDKQREQLNSYIYLQAGYCTDTFEKMELDYYEKNYGMALQEQNRKFEAKRQKNRIKDMNYWLEKDKKKMPEEIILQLGNKDENYGSEILESCIYDFCNVINERYKSNFHLLNVAIHNDEATPHVHLRAVFDYIDKDGIKKIGTDKALEALGIEKPKADKKTARYNNRKQSFTAEIRTIWYDVIKSYGIFLDEEVKNPSRKHKETQQFIMDKNKETISSQKIQLAQQEKLIRQNADIIKGGNYKKVLDEVVMILEQDMKNIDEISETDRIKKKCAEAVINGIIGICQQEQLEIYGMNTDSPVIDENRQLCR